MGFFSRWIYAFVLIAVTYNPTSFNYLSWAQLNYENELPMTVFLGLIIGLGYSISLRTIFRAVGWIGSMVLFVLMLTLLWVLDDWGLLAPGNQPMLIWAGILAFSALLAVGLSWDLVRRRVAAPPKPRAREYDYGYEGYED